MLPGARHQERSESRCWAWLLLPTGRCGHECEKARVLPQAVADLLDRDRRRRAGSAGNPSTRGCRLGTRSCQRTPAVIEPRKTAGDLVHRTAPPANPRLVGVVHVRHADALNLRRSADVGARAVERIHEERTHRLDVPLLNPVLAERLLLQELELLLAQPELLTRKLQLLRAHLPLRPTREEVAQEAERRRHPNCNGEWICHGLVLTKKPGTPRQGTRLGLMPVLSLLLCRVL